MQPTHATQESQGVTLHAETRTMVPSGDDYLPIIRLNGRLVPVDPPLVPSRGWGGYRLTVIEQSRLTVEGVVLSKAYNQETGDASGYKQIFTTMLEALKSGGFLDSRYYLVLATYGAVNAFPPPTDFLRLLQDAGAGAQLDEWLRSAESGIGTSHISAYVNYILAGNMKCGTSQGNEKLGLYPVSVRPPVPHTDVLDIVIGSQGDGHPSVLVPATSAAGA
jgi:hypothetical protein